MITLIIVSKYDINFISMLSIEGETAEKINYDGNEFSS